MLLLNNFWQLFLLSAPWLLLGLLVAGLIKVYLPADFLIKHLGKEGFTTTIKAALIGAPMPLCSCGVIPAALALRRAGASKSATTAFLVSTPETGVDSISVSYVLLGPFMAVIRPIAAITSAIVAGVLVGREHHPQKDTSAQPIPPKSCCASKAPAPVVEKSCCSDAMPEKPVSCCSKSEPEKSRPWEKFSEAVAFSCTKLLEDTAKWLVIGLFFAALIQTYVPADFFTQWGHGLFAMLVVILVSIPMYICATASTPIAAGLLLSGVSPGAVLVFMLAGPATNIATLGVVANELGKRAVIAYLSGVIGVAIIFGWLTDYLVEHFHIEVAPMLGEHQQVLPYWLTQLAGISLLILLLRLVYLRYQRQ